jgi:Avidin family
MNKYEDILGKYEKISSKHEKISGVWYNELGSKMTLTADKDGGLCGTYKSAVGSVQDFYILAGRFDASPPRDRGVSVGWAVTFRNDVSNAHSTATWSGQYFDGGGGDSERILTNWLLTSSTTPSSVWNSTNVGHDTFTRNPPNAKAQDETAEALALEINSANPKDILSHFFCFVRPASHPFFLTPDLIHSRLFRNSEISRESKIPGFCMV